MDNFESWLKEEGLAIPAGYLDEHRYALRFLNPDNDNDSAYDLILQMDEWLSESFIPAMRASVAKSSSCKEEASTSSVVIYRRKQFVFSTCATCLTQA